MELPLLKPIYEKYRDKGFEIVAVDYKHDTEGALKFIEEKDLPFVFLENGAEDEEVAFNIFGIQGFPTTYIIDREGKIMFYHRGFRAGNEAQMEEEIKILLEE
ncbi:MAG TPA: TlpA disulfide reductase family protein [Acidobacteriota bacterium]|nr:TlpA disulfide reductase family protein [Acidobacteriota bacterium]